MGCNYLSLPLITASGTQSSSYIYEICLVFCCAVLFCCSCIMSANRIHVIYSFIYLGFMMTSSNGKHFRVTGHFFFWGGNSPVTGEFPSQRPVMRSFDIVFDLRLHKRLSKQGWGWWCETPSRPLWRHCNVCFHAIWQSSIMYSWMIWVK